MGYEEFKQAFMEAVENEIKEQGIEGVSVSNEEVVSPDGMNDRMLVKMEGSSISMAFRFQEIYNNFDGEIEDHAITIVDSIRENLDVREKEEGVKDLIKDYEKAKDHLLLRLIPGDSPAVAEAPHEMIEDMALVVNLDLVGFSDDNGRACVIVTNPLLSMYGVSEKELFDVARANSMVQEPLKFEPLQSMIASLIKDSDMSAPDMDDVAFIATNTSGFNGASVLGYPDFTKEAEKVMGGSFYMIPSSVHEFILLKDDGNISAKTINNMIKDVNENVLQPRDKLSAQCYHYDAKKKKLENGLKYDKAKEKKAGAR
ncbi:MAG: hypothetical protein IK123_11400 [Lachnospiraceae bacterium]|nr:hypothetical protein [Lachnospiraceae bacterium]